MKVEAWENLRPISPCLPAVQDRRYVSALGTHRFELPLIDQEQCNVCSLCWISCPEGAISRLGGQITIDPDDCRGCGLCSDVCPRKAISMTEELK